MKPESSERLVSLDVFRGVTIGAMIIVNNLQNLERHSPFPAFGALRVERLHPGRPHLPVLYFHRGRHNGLLPRQTRPSRGKPPETLSSHLRPRRNSLLIGPFGLQLVPLRLAVPIHLPTRSGPGEHVGHFFLAPSSCRRLVFFPGQPADSGGSPAHCPGLSGGGSAGPPYPLTLAPPGPGDYRDAAAPLLGADVPAGLSAPPRTGPGAYLDRALFGEDHLWRFTRTWDPEGLLGTLPAIATGLGGALTGYWLKSGYDRHSKFFGLLLFGCLGVIVGAVWGLVFPINKYLWTSSYAVYTAGFALVFLAPTTGSSTSIKGSESWPGLSSGWAPTRFSPISAPRSAPSPWAPCISAPLSTTPTSVPIIQNFFFGKNWDVIDQTGWQDPSWPMLYWAVIYLTFWTLLTGLLYRKRIFFRV